MTAVAVHPDKSLIDRSHDRPITEGKLAEGNAGIVMKGKNSITRKTVEQSFVYHDLGAAEILFRRLENQMNGSVEIAPLSQSLGSTEQHRRMAIMSTGMHQTRGLAGIGQICLLMNGKRVDIGTNADRLPARSIRQSPDDPGFRKSSRDLVSQSLELPRNDLGSPFLLEPQFRVGMKVMPQCCQLWKVVANSS